MYSKIDARFWDDEKVLALSPDARYLMLYLLTTKHRNVLGCYQMPRAYAQEDTRLPEKKFSQAWNELISSGIIVYDDNTRMLLVRNFLKYNPIENPNQAKGALSRLEGVPKSPLFLDIYRYIQAQMQQENKDYLTPLVEAIPKLIPEPLPQPLRKPFTEPLSKGYHEPDNSIQYQIKESSSQRNIPLSNQAEFPNRKPAEMCISGSGNPQSKGEESKGEESKGEDRIEKELIGQSRPTEDRTVAESNNPTQKPRRKKPSTLSKGQEDRFNRFWAIYPKKAAIGDAEKAWAKIEPDDDLAVQIIEAVLRAKQLDRRFRDTQFIPHPASWLNGREWLNEYDTTQKSGDANGTGTDRQDFRPSNGFNPSTGFKRIIDTQ